MALCCVGRGNEWKDIRNQVATGAANGWRASDIWVNEPSRFVVRHERE